MSIVIKNFVAKYCLPDNVLRAANAYVKVEDGLIFTRENMTEIIMILCDIVPSWLASDDIHLGRITHLLYRLSILFKVNLQTLKDAGRFLLIKPESLEAQGLEHVNQWVSFIGLLFTGAIPSMLAVRKVTDMLRLAEISIRMHKQTNIGSFFLNLLPEVVKSWFDLSENNLVGDLKNKIIEIKGFLLKARTSNDVYFNTAETKRFKVYAEWLDTNILEFSCEERPQVSLIQLFRDLKRELVEVSSQFLDEDFNPYPYEPFCVYIYGQAGTGKSFASRYIAAYVNAKTARVKPANLCFVKNPGDQYACGYRGQFCWIYDDFGQDQSGDEALELIKYITPQQAPMNMASMNDPNIGIKGTKNTSQLFICCSNIGYPLFPKLAANDAFYRRRHLLLKFDGRNYVRMNPMRDEVVEYVNEDVNAYILQHFNRHMENQKRLKEKYSIFMSTINDDSLIQSEGDEYMDASPGTDLAVVEQIVESYSEKIKVQCARLFDIIKKYKTEFTMALTTIALTSAAAAYCYNRKKESVEIEDDNFFLYGINAARSSDSDSCSGKSVKYTVDDFVKERNIAPTNEEFTRNVKNVVPEASSEYFVNNKSQKNGRNVKRDRYSNDFSSRLKNSKIVSHGSTDPIADDVVKMLSKQMIKIITKAKTANGVRTLSMHGLPIVDNVVLAPRHLFMFNGHYIEGTIEIQANWNYPLVNFNSDDIQEFVYDGIVQDVVLYRMGPRVRTFKNLVNHFISENDLDKMNVVEGSLLSTSNDVFKQTHTLNSKIMFVDLKYDASGVVQELGDVLVYNIPTNKGDCGSPFVLYNTYIQGKILGIHVAGDTARSIGFAKIVTREMLQTKLLKYKCLVDGCGVDTIQKHLIQAEGYEWDIDLPYLGVIDKPHYLAEKTNYVPSKVFEYAGAHATEPSILTPKDERGNGTSPLLNAIGKNRRVLPLNLKIFNKVKDHLYIYYKSKMRGKLGTVSEYVAINGISTNKYLEKLNMKSSAGWPYIQLPEYKNGKECLFDCKDNEYVVSHPLLRKRIDERLTLAKLGKRTESLWLDNLKDETLPLKKIVSNDTRGFTIGPLDFTIVARMYTLRFAAEVMCQHNDSPIKIGINPYSLEWSQLAYLMQEVGNTGFAGDYTKYDGSIHAEIVDYLFMLIAEISEYNEEQTLVMKVLANEIIHTITVARKQIYMTCGGNPSGNALTSIINSFVNHAYMLYAYYSTVPLEMQNFVTCEKYVRYAFFGDDNLVFVHRKLHQYYNMSSVQNVLATIGITYTSETKEATDVSFRPIEQCTFLSNGFRKEGSTYKATLKLRSILEMANWVSRKLESEQATRDNVNTALRYAYFHGRDIFDKLTAYWFDYAQYSYTYFDELYNNYGYINMIEEFCIDAQADDVYDPYFIDECRLKAKIFYDKHPLLSIYPYDYWLDKVMMQYVFSFDHCIVNFDRILNESLFINTEAQGNHIVANYNMQGWNKVTAKSLPMEVTGDKLDLALKASAMDKPSVTMACPPTIMKDYQGLANGTNIEYMNKLSLNANCQNVATAANTGDTQDEMSIDWLKRRWGFEQIIAESTAWANNDNLIYNRIEPTRPLRQITATASANTPLCLITSMASFWRGSLEYKIIFFTDGFTTAKFLLDFQYGSFTTTFAATPSSMYSAILDVSPHKYQFLIRAPFMHCNSWCMTRNFNDTHLSTNATRKVPFLMKSTLGIMQLRVLNAPSGGPGRAKLRVLVLIRGGEDFELAMPGAMNLTLTPEAQGDETIVGVIADKNFKFGSTDSAFGTVVNTIGTSAVEMPNPMNSIARIMTKDSVNLDDYFSKWQLIVTPVTINTNSTTNTYRIFQSIIGYAPWRTILRQYMYFTAECIELRVEVNGNPYNAGGCIVAHQPCGGASNVLTSPTAIWGLQHTILNYNTTSSCVIKAPFINDSEFIPIHYITDYPSVEPFGTIGVNMDTIPLLTSTADKPNYSIYMRIINPVCKVPTNITAQGDEKITQAEETRDDLELITIGEFSPLPRDYTVGDPFTSLRDLTKRYVPCGLFGANNPHTVNANTSYTVTLGAASLLFNTSYFRTISAMYGLYRGGMRFKMSISSIALDARENHNIDVFVTMLPTNETTTVNSDFTTLHNYYFGSVKSFNSIPIDSTSRTGFLEFEVPFGRNNSWDECSNDYNNITNDFLLAFTFQNRSASAVNFKFQLFMSGADDMRFRGFLGTENIKAINMEDVPDYYDVE